MVGCLFVEVGAIHGRKVPTASKSVVIKVAANGASKSGCVRVAGVDDTAAWRRPFVLEVVTDETPAGIVCRQEVEVELSLRSKSGGSKMLARAAIDLSDLPAHEPRRIEIPLDGGGGVPLRLTLQGDEGGLDGADTASVADSVMSFDSRSPAVKAEPKRPDAPHQPSGPSRPTPSPSLSPFNVAPSPPVAASSVTGRLVSKSPPIVPAIRNIGQLVSADGPAGSGPGHAKAELCVRIVHPTEDGPPGPAGLPAEPGSGGGSATVSPAPVHGARHEAAAAMAPGGATDQAAQASSKHLPSGTLELPGAAPPAAPAFISVAMSTNSFPSYSGYYRPTTPRTIPSTDSLEPHRILYSSGLGTQHGTGTSSSVAFAQAQPASGTYTLRCGVWEPYSGSGSSTTSAFATPAFATSSVSLRTEEGLRHGLHSTMGSAASHHSDLASLSTSPFGWSTMTALALRPGDRQAVERYAAERLTLYRQPQAAGPPVAPVTAGNGAVTWSTTSDHPGDHYSMRRVTPIVHSQP